MKTGKQIQEDILKMMQDSVLGHSLTGKVYRDGYRPRDSKKEDAVVIFTTGTSDQIQRGIITINIFVPDKDYYQNGQLLENGQRTDELEKRAQRWVNGLTCDVTPYKFELRQAITTDYEPSIHQHFVVVILQYEYYTGSEDVLPVLGTEDGIIEIYPAQLKKEQSHEIEIQD